MPGNKVPMVNKRTAKKCVLRCFRKKAIDLSERSDRGRLFQRVGAHELKARDPVTVLVLETFNSDPWFDRRVWVGGTDQ